MPTTTLPTDGPESGGEGTGSDTQTHEGHKTNCVPKIDGSFVPGTLLEQTTFGSMERYDWNACSIQVAITIHPDDGHSQGRLVTIAAWTHCDPPVTRTLRRDEIGHFPRAMRDALLALKSDLPNRERIAFERRRAAAEKAAKDDEQRREAAARRTKPAKKPEKFSHTSATKLPSATGETTATHGKDVATLPGSAPQAGLFT